MEIPHRADQKDRRVSFTLGLFRPKKQAPLSGTTIKRELYHVTTLCIPLVKLKLYEKYEKLHKNSQKAKDKRKLM